MQIVLEKEANKRLSSEKVHEQLQHISRRILASNRQQRGWSVKLTNLTVQDRLIPYKYSAELTVECSIRRDTIAQEFENIVSIARNAAIMPKWRLVSYTDTTGSNKAVAPDLSKAYVGYTAVEIPKDWRTNFTHIYEREAQIEIAIAALEAAIKSNWVHRFHVLLWGPPACGKTEISLAIKDMIGDHAVLQFDATSTTQAGAIKELNERDELPRILEVEELEKADEGSMRWLLGVLDYRGEIRKTTARAQIQRDVKMFCIATVNDMDAFSKVMYGALASRFAHKLYCPRPSDKVLNMILKREIDRVNGKVAWIKPALDYAKKINTHDPREVLAICLSGRDDLLNGKFQAKLDKVRGDQEQHIEQHIEEPAIIPVMSSISELNKTLARLK